MLNYGKVFGSELARAVGVGSPGGGNLEVVGVIGAKKAEPLLHAMNDGVAEGHGEDLGDGAEVICPWKFLPVVRLMISV